MRISFFYGPVTWSRMDSSKSSAKEVFLAIGTVLRLSSAFLCTSPTKPRGFLDSHILLYSPVVVCRACTMTVPFSRLVFCFSQGVPLSQRIFLSHSEREQC